MTLTKTVAHNIREWRRLKNVKQDVLAERINLDNTTLSKIENSSSEPSLTLIEKIATALEITPFN